MLLIGVGLRSKFSVDPVRLDSGAHHFHRTATVYYKANAVQPRAAGPPTTVPPRTFTSFITRRSPHQSRRRNPKMPNPSAPTRNADPLHGAASA
jgi:hypothetical protein